MAIRICLDAGHYGSYNRSPAVPEYYEAKAMWDLHIALKAELERRGLEVITTRAEQARNLPLVERGRAAKGCSLFISLHSNAAGSGVNETVDYPVAYVMLDGSSTEPGLRLARTVEHTMHTTQAARTNTRRGENGEYYGVLRGAAAVGVPGIILEHSFHTNTRAAQWLMNAWNLARLAAAEADTIAAYYGCASQRLKITGAAKASKEQLSAYLLRNNPAATRFAAWAGTWLDVGAEEGIRGDIAFAQACLETGFFTFTGDVAAAQNNFAGIGAVGGGAEGASFDSILDGIRAQIQHLKAYANTEPLVTELVDPRFYLVTRGCAPYVEDLAGRWATDPEYAVKIRKILDAILATEPEAADTASTAAAANAGTSVRIGQERVSAMLIDGVTYVSLRPLCEAIEGIAPGCKLNVSWTREDGAAVDAVCAKPNTEGLSFGAAVELMRDGHRVCRGVWNTRKLRILHIAQDRLDYDGIYADELGHGVYTPWMPTYDDMLARDWETE